MTHIHISALSSDMNPQVRAWSRRSGSNRRPAAYKLVRAKRCADLRICWSRSSVRAPVVPVRGGPWATAAVPTSLLTSRNTKSAGHSEAVDVRSGRFSASRGRCALHIRSRVRQSKPDVIQPSASRHE